MADKNHHGLLKTGKTWREKDCLHGLQVYLQKILICYKGKNCNYSEEIWQTPPQSSDKSMNTSNKRDQHHVHLDMMHQEGAA